MTALPELPEERLAFYAKANQLGLTLEQANAMFYFNEKVRERASSVVSSFVARCSRCGRYEDGLRQCPNGDPACPVAAAKG
jgi:hypothetical protein